MTEKKRNINWFKDRGKRMLVIERFYDELERIGINYDIGLVAHEHIHDFQFRFDEKFKGKLPANAWKLISKYEKVLNRTCVGCGIQSTFVFDYNCRKCFFEFQKKTNYENISDLGFSAFAELGVEGDQRRFFQWSEFSTAEFFFESGRLSEHFPNGINLNFKPTKDDLGMVDWLFISDWKENYFNLLKHIPGCLLSEEGKLVKADLINNLDDCIICGYKAVYKEESCLVCGLKQSKSLNIGQIKKYLSVEECNKASQLEYYCQNKDRFKYPRREPEFEKSRNHRMLITKDELKKVIKKRQ